jgi:hypothetical protein
MESDDGKIYLSDADLSDISIDYIKSLVDFPIEPWVAVKEGNPVKWHVTQWAQKGAMLGALMSSIRRGGKNIVFVDGAKEKSTWGTKTLEAFLKQEFPSLRILRIDANSVSDPEHEAYGCIKDLDKIIPNFDLILASPTIETGVSINLTGYLTAVWDFAQGVIPVGSVIQRMWRVREAVPRHYWAASYGIGTIGNGSTSPKSLMACQELKFKAHTAALRESDFTTDLDIAIAFQPQSLRTWVKMANRINYGMIDYCNEITRALLGEGHTIIPGNYAIVTADDPEAGDPDQLEDLLKETKEVRYEAHCQATAEKENPDDKTYEELNKKKTHTAPELKALRKGTLSRRYSEELATNPDLIKLDDNGELQKARLHYYLTEGREFLSDRDKQVVERMLLSGEGEIFLPDANRNLIGGKVKMMDILGLTSLMKENGERATDDHGILEVAAKIVQYKKEVKAILGVSVREKTKPFPRVQELLRRTTGLAFGAAVKTGAKGQQRRMYQPIEIPKVRQQIIITWLEADKLQREQDLLERQQQCEQQQPEQQQQIYGELGTKLPTVSDSDTVSSTWENTNLLLPVLDTVSKFDTKPVLDTEPIQSQEGSTVEKGSIATDLEVLVDAVEAVGSFEEFSEVARGREMGMVEDAIIFASTQPKRHQLTEWYEQLQSEERHYVSLAKGLGEAVRVGLDAVKGFISRLDLAERWAAVGVLEKSFPEAMGNLMAIAPNWSELLSEECSY